MIKKFIKRLLGQSDAPPPPPPPPPVPVIPLGERVEVPASEHRINPALLDANAVRVVRTLKEAGHQAYIVGGAVRDLLAGMRPKDFDVATDATPEQVKALFRRAFIIGRRFRLVHVVFGRGREHEVIEVSTFRAYMDPVAPAEAEAAPAPVAGRAESADRKHVVDAAGRVLRDNVWGPQIEDAARRDFTINAMYYDPLTQTVVDYHGGLADVRAGVLRMIGDAAVRYREDPVRIIRVVRFAAKLGFALEPATEQPLRSQSALLANVPVSRLFDEMIKLLQTGHALASIEQLRRFGLIGGARPGVFPVLDAALAPACPDPAREAFVRLALKDTDLRVSEGRPVAPSWMLACLLWHDVRARWNALRESGEAPVPALHQAVDAVFEARIGDISGRGKLAADMREVWAMQPRFERRTSASAHALVGQARFRAGYDFLRLRADCGEVPVELADWWEDFHLGSDEDREALLEDVRASQHQRGRRAVAAPAAAAPRPSAELAGAAARQAPPAGPAGAARRASEGDLGDDQEAGDSEDDAPDAGAGTADETAVPAARKRRRRRRKPAGARDGGPTSADGGGSGPVPGAQ